VGSEGKRLSNVFSGLKFRGLCVLPPYPRKMGTDVPDFVKNITFELPNIDFTKTYLDSCTTVALQTAIFCCANEIYIIGYDGYSNNMLSEKERVSVHENNVLFDDFKIFYNKSLVSLAPSLYTALDTISIYQLIY
jgi:4-hydroxy 2-oxovalerate aldolase